MSCWGDAGEGEEGKADETRQAVFWLEKGVWRWWEVRWDEMG